MIIITDGNGNLQAPTIPENVYQGSNNANSIVFLSPLPQSNSATIVFKLPNGLLTPEYLMTPFDDVPSKYELNAWVRDIDKDITALYGTVTYQIFLKNASGVVVSSVAGTFNVLKGVAPLPATTPSTTSWNEILEYISQINGDIENGWLVSKGILPYDATFEYPLNATLYDNKTSAFYISLKEKNKGNSLNDVNFWKKIDTAIISEYVDSKIEEHNTSSTAHQDLRVLINNNTNKINQVEDEVEENATNLQNNYYTKTETYNKNEVDQKIESITSVQIRNKQPNPIITATSETIQNVATQYIVDNYSRQPQNWDGLIITITDLNNDKILYIYSSASSLWINSGVNNVDLSNYVDLTSEQTITGNKNFTGNLQKNGKNVATVESDLSSLKDLNLTYGEETLTYDTTDGMTISATGQATYGENNAKQTFDTEFNVPIVPADESITIDVNQTNKKFTIKGKNALITADSENNVSLCDIVQYNTTDGATFENLKVKNVNTEDTREATLNLTLPIIAGDNVTIDADETNSKLKISADIDINELDYKLDAKNPYDRIGDSGELEPTYAQSFSLLNIPDWNIPTTIGAGADIWSWGNYAYFYNDDTEKYYRIGKDDENWQVIEFQGIPQGTIISKIGLFHTNSELFYSFNGVNLVFDADGLTWNEIVWTGAPANIQGNLVWGNMYHNYTPNTYYAIDFTNRTFEAVTWSGLPENEDYTPTFANDQYIANGHYSDSDYVYKMIYDYDTKSTTFYKFNFSNYECTLMRYKGNPPKEYIKGWFSTGSNIIEDAKGNIFNVYESSDDIGDYLEFSPAYVDIGTNASFGEEGILYNVFFIGQELDTGALNLCFVGVSDESYRRKLSAYSTNQAIIKNRPDYFQYIKTYYPGSEFGSGFGGNFKFDGTNLTVNGKKVLTEGNGGSSVNVVQETGTSTTDVMSQNSVTTELNKKVNTDGTTAPSHIYIEAPSDHFEPNSLELQYDDNHLIMGSGGILLLSGSNGTTTNAIQCGDNGLALIAGFLSTDSKTFSINKNGCFINNKQILSSPGSSSNQTIVSVKTDGTQQNLKLGNNLYIDIQGALNTNIKGNVQTVTYDNTTLADHITEILGYVNTENGGNLININFKVAAAVTGEMKTVTNTLSTNTLTNSSSTVPIINADEMISMTVGAVRNGSTSGKKVTFTCSNDTNICSFTNVDISNINGTNVATISGQEIDFGTGTIITNYFKDVNILNVSLEHLVINYFTM